ncbi:MAG: hypothetical protein GY847_39445 [Proteobacteria bacterium]|nr:hypothetical protein [Pseudomonadota bacterium]
MYVQKFQSTGNPLLVFLGMCMMIQCACSDNGARWKEDAGNESITPTECDPVEWGSGFQKGQPIANWDLRGFIDANGDYLVEQEEVEFTLKDIHCSGKESLVLVMGEIG